MSGNEHGRPPKLFRLPEGRGRLRGDIERELRFHIEGRIDELVAQGRSREEAEREVSRRFGDVTTVRDECEEIDTMTQRHREWREWRSAIARDVSHAFRGMAKRPGYAAVVVLTLALGIGATTSIYALLDAVVLRPLAYAAPDELVRIQHPVPGVGSAKGAGGEAATFEMSQAGYFFFRKHAKAFADIGVYTGGESNFITPDGAERIKRSSVSASLLNVLRVRPVLGRAFTDADNMPNAAPVVMLGYDFWQRRFDADPAIIGKSITLTSTAYEVIGVMPRGFDMPNWQAQLWAPLRLDPDAPAVNAHFLQAIARLAPGATVAAAQADAARLTSRLPEEFPNAYSDRFMTESQFTVRIRPLRDVVIGDISRTLWILLASVGIVLLIACANVANLVLVRAEARRRELAIRTALGADRLAVAGHFLTESLVLSLIGGLLGAVLAFLALRMVVILQPASIPRLTELAFGWRPAAASIVLALGAGVLLGFLPLARVVAGGVDVSTLREGGRGQTASRGQLSARNALIVAQMALAVLLLAGAGLMLRSFQRLRAVDPGLDPTGVLTFDVMMPFARYGGGNAPDSTRYLPAFRFHRDFLSRLTALPDVKSAVLTTALPVRDAGGCSAVFVDGRQSAEKDAVPCVPASLVSPGYFGAMGIAVRGRAPTWSDVEARQSGVVVGKALADRLWPGEDPIGKRLRPNGFEEPYYEVVGVASDVRGAGLDQPPSEIVYYPLIPKDGAPLWQPPTSATIVVRSASGNALALTPAVRRVLQSLDREVPMANVETMESVVAHSTARTTFAMLLLAMAGGMALVLAAVGIYGVISYTVSQRRAEIGVRMALGAQASQVGRMVVGQSLRVAGVGIALGLVGALATTRVMQSLLFGVSPTDPVTLGAVTLLLVAIGALASYLPARRASAVDPVEVLRQ